MTLSLPLRVRWKDKVLGGELRLEDLDTPYFHVALPGADLAFHGYLNTDGVWAAGCLDEATGRRLALLPRATLEGHSNATDLDWSDEGVPSEDQWRSVATAMSLAILAGDTTQPAIGPDLPGAFDLPNVEPWDVEWEAPDTAILYLPEDEVDEPWGRFNATISIVGHACLWSAWFMDASMAGDAPEWGWAAWTDDLLLAAGECPDIEDSGYLAFRMMEPAPSPGSPRFDPWRVALARAILTRGRMPADKSAFGFRVVE